MALRRAFRTGRCVVVAIPKQFQEALRIVPGTDVIITLRNRELVITRGFVMAENLMAPPPSAAPVDGGRDEEPTCPTK